MIDSLQRELLNEPEAAEFLGVEPATLATWRCRKRYNLPYIKVGRLVRYHRADLLAFVESRKVVSQEPQPRSRRRGR